MNPHHDLEQDYIESLAFCFVLLVIGFGAMVCFGIVYLFTHG